MERFSHLLNPWTPPPLPENLPHGDMPGDKVCIGPEHIMKANALFPALKALLAPCLSQSPFSRAVVAVCGGSGVGKSETASLLGFYLGDLGVKSYVLSGDNYPRRMPSANDAERLRVYRVGGLRGLITGGLHTMERNLLLRELWETGADADPGMCEKHPWLRVYQREARSALSGYLGSDLEIDFNELTGLVARFKQGAPTLLTKCMGRAETELWYEEIDVTDTNVLLIEWTHGNSDRYQGVDIPILLNSTPAETLEHRRARHRDGGTDSPFTSVVLELEQKMLEAQADKARLIISKSGELLSYAEYRGVMASERERGAL